MNFLVGLNESFHVTRSQILLMDPLPPISRVFSLLVQEENQRSLSVSTSNNHLLTMATRTDINKKSGNVYKKRERPLCTHCGLNGHTVDTCYKLHGYPPGYKTKTRLPKINGVNMVNSEGSHEQTSDPEFQNLLQNLNHHQYQQLSQIFSTQSHPTTSNNVLPSDGPTNITCCVSAPATKTGNLLPNTTYQSWIIDSGASRHICNDKNFFLSLKSVAHTSILLPDNTSFPVKLVGTIHLT